jgi:tetratricopeptide (TPR) repeat protein
MQDRRAGARRYTQAVELFEKGVRALGRKDVERALELFREVDSSFQDQPDVAERARAYEGMCLRVRERERRPHKPKGFEDILGNGVVLLNRGEYAEAVKAFHNAAEIHPRNEHVQYCLAAANARVGDLSGAVKALRSAIHANPANRAQARSDPDFETLRGREDFEELLGHSEAV